MKQSKDLVPRRTVLKFHRLTVDLDVPDYAKLKAIANRENRTASKQAKVMLVQLLAFKKGSQQGD